ncbi:hypothetical protein AB0A63_16925 [Lentzea sp. NPDC042327]|uniref:hypothetical protein n=1 Tax=Lentzea sp. NPDC042327 TaxID=3154801 RepID=UPI0033E59448
MSRSGLLRAAALLAAGAAPLLAGTANAAEAPVLDGGVPDVGADQLISDAKRHVDILEVDKAVKLPTVSAPVGEKTATLALPRERSAANPVAPELGSLPGTPSAETLLAGSQFGGLQTPQLSDLPTNTVLSGILPTING